MFIFSKASTCFPTESVYMGTSIRREGRIGKRNAIGLRCEYFFPSLQA